MKLVIINSSPKGKNGNTELILNSFIKGLMNNKTYEIERFYINKDYKINEIKDKICSSDLLFIAFPLYLHA